MLTLKTEKEMDYIVKNVKAACKDITKLTKAGYDFLYVSSGFIAHYNRHGFIDYYRREANLRRDILNNAGMNTWRNFSPGEKDYLYYHQKGEIYNRIVLAIQ